LIFLAALFGYVNSRFLKLAPTIGLMLQAFVVSLILIAVDLLGFSGIGSAREVLSGIDFNRVLFQGLLSFLLFAGALQIRLPYLSAVRGQVAVLATVGVVISTFAVGFASYGLLVGLGAAVPVGYCLLFGALISPTDPVAVLPVIRRAKAPAHLEALVSGEALFNDGVAVVIFSVLLTLTSGTASSLPLPVEAIVLLAREAVGGLAFGLALGYLGYRVVKTIDDYPIEILITLALVSGGYAIAQSLGISGPLAMVAAGIMMGTRGRALGMSERTTENLDRFWEMIEIILNAVLFVLIGLEAVAFARDFSLTRLWAALAAIPIVLLARLISVSIPFVALRSIWGMSYKSTPFLTWVGLRGAIPIALVLSLPPGSIRDVLTTMTYSVVVFSILVQGITVKYSLGWVRRD